MKGLEHYPVICAHEFPQNHVRLLPKNLQDFPTAKTCFPIACLGGGGNRVWGIFGNGDPRQRKAIWQLSTSKREKKDQSVPKRVPKNVPETQFRQIKRCNGILVDPLE